MVQSVFATAADSVTKPLVSLKNLSFQQLFSTRGSEILGNPHGKITMIEFFDYQCPDCRKIMPHLPGLLKKNPQVKLVIVDYPILGPRSTNAAKAALAAKLQGKYSKLHDAMMTAIKPLTSHEVDILAAQSGINVKQLVHDMTSQKVTSQLAAYHRLGQAISLRGVPTFIIGFSKPPYSAIKYEGETIDDLAAALKPFVEIIKHGS